MWARKGLYMCVCVYKEPNSIAIACKHGVKIKALKTEMQARKGLHVYVHIYNIRTQCQYRELLHVNMKNKR